MVILVALLILLLSLTIAYLIISLPWEGTLISDLSYPSYPSYTLGAPPNSYGQYNMEAIPTPMAPHTNYTHFTYHVVPYQPAPTYDYNPVLFSDPMGSVTPFVH